VAPATRRLLARRHGDLLLFASMRPLDRVIYKAATVQVGSFTCPTSDPRFRDSGPTENDIVVFPRNGVWIRHAGSRAFVADPQVVTIYNRGQEYTRELLSPDGDRCDWFAVAPAIAAEIARAYDERVGDSPLPFTSEFSACSPDLYLRQRRLFLRLERGCVDALEAEEAVIAVVAEVIARSNGVRSWSLVHDRHVEARRDLVERARAEIVANVARHDSVATLARRLGTSPFHLCRVFRSVTGITLHGYRLELRQRMLLERLAEPNADLSRIAMELGFSSHSHLSATLRQRSGMTPSALRRLLTPREAASATQR
jgi:AraC family transcriptional regulator